MRLHKVVPCSRTLHTNTYEMVTQWAAVTTHVAEINDPPQIKRPLRFRAIC